MSGGGEGEAAQGSPPSKYAGAEIPLPLNHCSVQAQLASWAEGKINWVPCKPDSSMNGTPIPPHPPPLSTLSSPNGE